MSGKNADVDRAIVAFGGISFPYQSFGAFGVPFDNVAHTVAFTPSVIVEAPPRYAPETRVLTVPLVAPLADKPFHESLPEVPPPVARRVAPVAPSFVAPSFVAPVVADPIAKPTYAVSFADAAPAETIAAVAPATPAPEPSPAPLPLPLPDKADRRSLADMFRLLQGASDNAGDVAMAAPPAEPVPVPVPDMPAKPREVVEKPRLFRRI